MKNQESNVQRHNKKVLNAFSACALVTSCFVLYFVSGSATYVSARPKFSILEIEGLVRVGDVDSTIVEDLRYATENNFTGKRVYPTTVCVLRRETAQKLAAANEEFSKDGYRIKIWDAYRPPAVQKIFWELVSDERYVANPYKGGSRHNRGSAVDVTLVDGEGHELEMPTEFDDFSEKASASSPFMSAEAKINMDYLAMTMTKHGFIQYEHEWWHFDDSDWKVYPLVDVKLEHFWEETDWLVLEPEILRGLDASVHQALIVEKSYTEGQHYKLTAWERENGSGKAGFQPAFPPMAAVVGRGGIAPIGEKKEGDGKTPSGIFQLGSAFGYAASVKTKLAYRQATEWDFWVDDPQSPDYNRWVAGQPHARSFERLKRDDDLYKYAVVIEYNTDPVVPSAGSAIFLHVWRGFDQPTVGCVALSEENLAALLGWLDQTLKPVIVVRE